MRLQMHLAISMEMFLASRGRCKLKRCNKMIIEAGNGKSRWPAEISHQKKSAVLLKQHMHSRNTWLTQIEWSQHLTRAWSQKKGRWWAVAKWSFNSSPQDDGGGEEHISLERHWMHLNAVTSETVGRLSFTYLPAKMTSTIRVIQEA